MDAFTKLFARLVFFLLLGSLAKESLAESLPEYRPALIGTHRRSLVNLIDTQSLMDRGQKDAIVMFECGISDQGYGFNSRTYRESPGSELLKKEVLGRLDQAQFEPAVYRHAHVVVYIHGTVMFLIKDGKPHLRIFLNQSDDDMKAGHDFIEPQFAFVPNNTAYKGIYSPLSNGNGGVATLKLNVDATGKVQGAGIVYEYPAGQKFGAAAMTPIRDALFIPGFRNGQPVACTFNWTLIFIHTGRQMRTG